MDCHDPQRLSTLPQAVLERFTPEALRNVVWLPAAGGYLGLRRPERCSNYTTATIVEAERRWLREAGVASASYPELVRHYAPLASDGTHFVYYHLRCNDTFPEVALLAARLTLHTALGQGATQACAPGE